MIAVGREQIENLKHENKYVHYIYHHVGGGIYDCMYPTLEECRRSRNCWIVDNYLLFNNQVVFKENTNEEFFKKRVLCLKRK